MPKKKTSKLSWADTTDLAFRLIDENPDVDATRLHAEELISLVSALPDFSDKIKRPPNEVLEKIRSEWHEERADMEDELGPVKAPPSRDDMMDEEDYRDDKMVDDPSVEEEDEDEDTFTSIDELEGDDEDEEEEF